MNNFAQLSAVDGTLFLVRWRGRQEGPYTGAAVEAKLAAHEIGLLHEVYFESRWMTIRDYMAGRQAAILAELQTQQQQSGLKLRGRPKEEVPEQVEIPPPETFAEQQRRDELLAAELLQPFRRDGPLQVPPKRHRGRQIFILGVAGLFVCGPLGLAAVIMGTMDLRQMDAGLTDASGRSQTSSGRNIGLLGAIVWLVGALFAFSALRH